MDKAERLHLLIGKINAAAVRTKIGNTPLVDVPLYHAIGPLANELGFRDYGLFREAYIALCVSVRDHAFTVDMKKESVRDSWVACTTTLSTAFDANRLGEKTGEVLSNHFTSRNLELIDAMSERFQRDEISESSPEELEAALSAVREVIEAFNETGKLDRRIAKVLLHHLEHMEAVFALANDFGDETFWKAYKETFGTFVQLHSVITELDNAVTITDKIRSVAEKLGSTSIVGISLAANLVTVGAAIWPHLLPAS